MFDTLDQEFFTVNGLHESICDLTRKRQKIQNHKFSSGVRTPLALYFCDVIGFLTTMETDSTKSSETNNSRFIVSVTVID